MKKQVYFLFVLFVLSLPILLAENSEIVRRAFFDIGSGSTKMIVADVHLKTGAVHILHEEAEKVSYKLDLEMGTSNEFSSSIQEKALLVMAKMKWNAIQKGAKQFAGIATSAFRSARNGKEFAEFMSKVFHFPIVVISQKEEAILGFIAAVKDEQAKLENIVVWDIGGGSMQITMLCHDNEYEIFCGDLASVSFTSYLIEKVKGLKISQVQTPNPISQEEYEKGIGYVHSVAKTTNKKIMDKLSQDKTLVLGIGGVHYYSVCGQIKSGKEYTQDLLKKTLQKKIGMSDKEIGGKYASTEVSNLILVLGYMQALGIEKVKAKDINIAHGVLLYQALWKQ